MRIFRKQRKSLLDDNLSVAVFHLLAYNPYIKKREKTLASPTEPGKTCQKPKI